MFGSIGTLVEPSNLQRRAFNRAFKNAGLDWNWTIDTYKRLLTTSGGRDRIQNYASRRGIVVDADHFHQCKTEIFDSLMANGDIQLRAGVKDVISFAAQNDIQLAFVTSTPKANVDAVFSALSDQLKRSDFAFVGNNTMVSQPNQARIFMLKRCRNWGFRRKIALQWKTLRPVCRPHWLPVSDASRFWVSLPLHKTSLTRRLSRTTYRQNTLGIHKTENPYF
jgi:hypothetical protein